MKNPLQEANITGANFAEFLQLKESIIHIHNSWVQERIQAKLHGLPDPPRPEYLKDYDEESILALMA